MDVNRRLGMRDTVLALLLAVLQGLPLGETAPNPSPLVGSNWGNPRRYVHLQTSTDLNNFYLEIRLDGTVCKTTTRTSYSVILLKAETRERVAILGVKSSRFLCMDVEGRPFSSPTCLRDDCLFNHKLLENNRDVYYSCRTGILFNLEGSRQVYSVGQNLPQTSLFLPKKNTVPLERLLLLRGKRNEVVDPSDPHNFYQGGTEAGSDSRAVPEDDTDLEVETEVETEAGDDGRNVSRETPMAPSSHDPWNAHWSNPASPRSSGTMG
ncbi:fibroblast growth factor 23 [Solea senegalensis]|uniref:Fibroblast growth factor 23 n=1 Tax=Solea senegalensis TaxID=28829 RepID=A0AAV6QV76_SOLSE|nr:fibroblast growth factor 23 [Solea senegalensis]KAG7496005.1 fibroblast growth factor 23 [Solea senegalensis]